MDNIYTESKLKSMKKEELIVIAEANGIELPEGATNPAIIALILEKGCPLIEDDSLPVKTAEEYNKELVQVVIHPPYYMTSDTHANYTVNGIVFSVAYGVPQTVPRFVKEVIDNKAIAERMLNNATNKAVSQGLEAANALA